MTLYGYGRILDVDLSTWEISKRDIDPEFAKKYVGGMGFSCKILYDKVGADVDPFSPDNMVIFANGPLTGTRAPCSGRTEITTKSPLTGIIGTGNTGGVWGATLKHAGFDLIIVRNQSDKPVYLLIDNDFAEVREASHLWGKDTMVTSDILREELGFSLKPKISVLTIGPAGENLVRYACPLNDYHHVAARNGAGAVMGAKRLKAIAVRGTGTVKVARPDEFREAVREARKRLMDAVKASGRSDIQDTKFIIKGTREIWAELGCLATRNYQTGVFPPWTGALSQEIAEKYITKKESTCYSCPIPCFDLAEVKEGKYAGVKANRGLHPGVVNDFGAKCAIDNLPAIWKCKETCQRLGMDYASPAGAIAFAMELYQRRLITTEDTDGLEMTWGNEDTVVRMLEKIAFRDGFGDILAEGSVRAAERIGKGAERYVMATKGMEMMAFDPRSSLRGQSFEELTNPRGGDNLKGSHHFADRVYPNWGVDKYDMFEDVKRIIYGVPPEKVPFTWEGKPMMCRWFEDLYSILNALGLCFGPSGMLHAWGPTYLSKMFSSCTGLDATPQDIMRSGERVFTLLKAYDVRQGLTRKDDAWPDRFYEEPLPEGPSKGAVLSRDTIDRLLDEYYEIRGWDKKTGLPTREKLFELGLTEVANELTPKV